MNNVDQSGIPYMNCKQGKFNIHLSFIYFIISESNVICPCLFKVADKPLDITWTCNFGIFEGWNELAATKPDQKKVRTPYLYGLNLASFSVGRWDEQHYWVDFHYSFEAITLSS